ncbi:MAG: 4-(cytidine 5'-diphospho)-2-C-methyl-D-erythritol kinase [Thermodesulfovibrionales bacterium]|nr:4-(cytidine 5'-diphospho)-2-C-methyl-D-erythritol kinase [Thermodesulfovibrionales bacterium]
MFTLKAPAKINWFLFILGKRADGYHEIQSLMQCISLYDTLTFKESGGIEIVTDSPILTDDNLIYRAALLLRKLTSAKKGARITLKKEIPLSSGMAGGSSDAACALIGLNRLWGLNLTGKQMSEAADSLGSDVPFFLNGPSALIAGRGEKVMPVALKSPCTLLLLKQDEGVSTEWAYSEAGRDLKKTSAREKGDMKSLCRAIGAGDFKSLKSLARNDLEGPVIRRYPAVHEMKRKLAGAGALFSAMSGSGPTVFGVFGDEKTAEEAKGSFPSGWSRVVKTLTEV